MSENTHSVAIGAFITAALLILATMLIFIGGSGLGRDTTRVVMVFDGSVKGLTLGAPVALRGVQIGQVTDITLILDTQTIDLIMVVEAEIRDDNIKRRGSSPDDFTEELIRRGLRAQLNSQSLLTGLLYIQLDFHPNSEFKLGDVDSPYMQIPTVPTDLERITREIESVDFAQLASDLQAAVAGLGKFVGSSAFQTMPARLGEVLVSLEGLSATLQTQLATTGPRLDTLLESVNSTVNSVETEIPLLSSSARDSLKRLDEGILAFEQAMSGLNELVAADSPSSYELNRAMREVASAGRAVQALAKTLEEQPESLIRGKKSGESR